jgi:phosphopantothenate-cysteine ligase
MNQVNYLQVGSPLRNILVTSGGTKVMIDRVRHIGNMSHGTFGSKIALAILKQRPDVMLNFLTATGARTPFSVDVNWAAGGKTTYHDALVKVIESRKDYEKYGSRYDERTYKTFDEYMSGVFSWLDVENMRHDPAVLYSWGHSEDMRFKPGIVVLAAAASDYLVSNYVNGKIRSSDSMNIELEPAPKVISMIRQKCPTTKIVGFKLLVDSTEEELARAAQESAQKNDCEFVVANDLRDIQSAKHRVMIVDKGGVLATYETDPQNPNFLAEKVATWIGLIGEPKVEF